MEEDISEKMVSSVEDPHAVVPVSDENQNKDSEKISSDEGNESPKKQRPDEAADMTSDTNMETEEKADEKCADKTETKDQTESAVTHDDAYAAHVHYENDIAVYTDPSSKYQYVWDNDKNEWVPRDAQQEESTETNVPKDPQQGEYGYEGDQHTYTDADGVVYLWDSEKSAWFPKLDEEFMARYQLSYGVDTSKESFGDDGKDVVAGDKDQTGDADQQRMKKGDGKRKAPADPTWFELPQDQNTKVYVSGLPLDITEEEFVELMSKCGLVEKDNSTQKMKVKLYTDTNGYLKGDALCTYIRVESVELALNLLDGSDMRGNKIRVQRAKFEMKGDYNPAFKPKKKRKRDKEKEKKMKEKLFDWRPEKMRGERSKHERVVVLRNLFEPKLFDEEVELILEFQQDLREECSKLGEVRRVVLYDRHPEGIAQITMAEPEQAEAVVALMNGRWFNKRQLKAEIWDGKTKFKIGETDSEITQRLTGWDKFLEGDEAKKAEQDKVQVHSETKPETTDQITPSTTI